MKRLALLAVAIPSAALAQAGPSKLVITWFQSNLTVVDYPTAARCEVARRVVEEEIARRARESDAAMPPGAIKIGKSPNGAFCIPG